MNKTQINFAMNTLDEIKFNKLNDLGLLLGVGVSKGYRYNDSDALTIGIEENAKRGLKNLEGFEDRKIAEIRKGKLKMIKKVTIRYSLGEAYEETTEEKNYIKTYNKNVRAIKKLRDKLNVEIDKIKLEIALGDKPDIKAMIEKFRSF